MTKYERIVAAALKAKGANIGLAESLALDIPEGASEIIMQLEEAAVEIEDAGGDSYNVSHLAKMRLAALWTGADGWRKGASLTAHMRVSSSTDPEVREWFYGNIRTPRDVQKRLGYKVDTNDVDNMSSSQIVEQIDALIERDSEAVLDRIAKKKADEAIEQIRKEQEKESGKPVTTSTARLHGKEIGLLMGEMLRHARQWSRFLTGRYERKAPELWQHMTEEERKEFVDALLTMRGSVDAILDSIEVKV